MTRAENEAPIALPAPDHWILDRGKRQLASVLPGGADRAQSLLRWHFTRSKA
jgi:hypothetical protein